MSLSSSSSSSAGAACPFTKIRIRRRRRKRTVVELSTTVLFPNNNLSTTSAAATLVAILLFLPLLLLSSSYTTTELLSLSPSKTSERWWSWSLLSLSATTEAFTFPTTTTTTTATARKRTRWSPATVTATRRLQRRGLTKQQKDYYTTLQEEVLPLHVPSLLLLHQSYHNGESSRSDASDDVGQYSTSSRSNTTTTTTTTTTTATSYHFPSMMDELNSSSNNNNKNNGEQRQQQRQDQDELMSINDDDGLDFVLTNGLSISSEKNNRNGYSYDDDDDDVYDDGNNLGDGLKNPVDQSRSQKYSHVTGQYPINGARISSNSSTNNKNNNKNLVGDTIASSSTSSSSSSSSSSSPKQQRQTSSRIWSGFAPEVLGWTSIMKRGLFFPDKKKKKKQNNRTTTAKELRKEKDKSINSYRYSSFSSSTDAAAKVGKQENDNLMAVRYYNGGDGDGGGYDDDDEDSSLETTISFPEKVDEIYKDLNDLSSYDQEQIDSYWEQLLPTVSYLGTEKVARVYDALRVAYRAHRGQARKSGEPFIIHPVEVSLLLAGLKMDEDTVMAGLLHDTVEDTDLSFELVEEMFGFTVRSIVEGETKVSKLPKLAFAEYADEQAENLRQMFVAMTDDYRIIIVKLADRLHNMRTLKHMKPEKQIKISRETLDIFAPLAHRMGIWQFKSELEDTAFMYLYPQEYNRLHRRLNLHHKKFQDTLERSQELLRDRLNSDPTLRDQAASVTVSGRMKEIYSLWHKMETKNERNLDHIVDVVALRVIITPKKNTDDDDYDDDDDETDSDRGVWLCYHVLGLVQHLDGFQPVPTRVKDYISFPKPNGYQSLHTALILNGQKVEVQIRTSMMHQVAEYGMASHWAYTDSKRRMTGKDDLYNTPWLSSIKEWQNEKLNARDFVDSVRNELLGKRVFVFLRNGKILNLARGCTAIDAAFQIHTEVGLNMHGVEINGKPVPVSYELQNGDVVSILTGEGKPSTDWMRFAKSRSTRSKLRSYFRSQQKESLWEAGKILLMDYLWMHGPLIEKNSYLDDFSGIPSTVEEIAPLLPGQTQFDDIDELLITIGKQNDRSLLHSFASKLFRVPKSLLVSAEENRSSLVPKSVLDKVNERRQIAMDAAAAAASAQSSSFANDLEYLKESSDDRSWPKPSNGTNLPSLVDRVAVGNAEEVEYADPEHLCETCLPIWGDEIVGTRGENASSDSVPCVHRLGCPIAQRAMNKARVDVQRASNDPFNYELGQKVDSVTLRRKINSRFQDGRGVDEVPVTLEWGEFPGPDEPQHWFPCEVIVHAEDRKLLLADCSEIVSELSEIVKTGSQTTNEHATLVFLIKIRCIDDLQKVMDRLSQIRSVMSVERRVRAETLS